MLSSLFWSYTLISILLKSFTKVNITVPCPIKQFLGIRCYGCGLTTASVHIVKFDFSLAWEANPFIFFIAPLILFFIVRHWWRFVQEHKLRHR